ncbi:MAG: deoxyribose-phosphate aldolase [Bacteroides sp.]|nr:deoxyribose-phosphate aldolase [Bacteroides sp.]
MKTENMDRYQEALASSKVISNDEAVKEEVKKIIEKAPENASPEVYQLLLNSIDLTTLTTTDSEKSVAAFTQRVNDFDNDYPQYKNVAAICVYSNFAEVVKTTLDVPGVDIAVVAGAFPSSQTFTAVKVADVALAVAAGANEVDIVFPVGMYLDGNFEDLTDEIIELKHTAKDAKLKVILETGALKTAEDIKRASVLSLYSEADFLKTSTGKEYPGASLEAAWVMCQCIKEYYELTGRKVGFKCSGGVRTTEQALQYYTLVKEILGEEWLNHDLFRIGASSLANAVLSSLEGHEVKYF